MSQISLRGPGFVVFEDVCGRFVLEFGDCLHFLSYDGWGSGPWYVVEGAGPAVGG